MMPTNTTSARWISLRPYLWIVGVSLLTSIAVTWPWRYRTVPVWSFWDGPSYLTIAKEGYIPKPGNPLAPNPDKPPFYISHLPAYPLTIRALALFGWTNAVLLSAWLAAVAAAVLFYRLCRDVWLVASPLWVTMAFLLLPPRWILYRSVGASEPLFLVFVLLAILFVERWQWHYAILASWGAALTRWTGVVVAVGWAYVLWRRGQWKRSLWLAPIPLSMLAFLTYASVQFGDWQAPLEINLDIVGRIQVLADVTYLASWPDNIRGELILMLVLFSAAAIWQIRKLKVPAGYCLTQLLFLLFVYGRDWPRYALAFTPILFALALQNVWKDRVMRWVLLPAAVLGVAWSRAAIPYNLMKEPDALLRHLGIGS